MTRIRHIAVFNFTASTSPADIEQFEERLGALPLQMPHIASYYFARNAGITDNSDDFVVVGEFDSPEDYESYRTHPDHLEVLAFIRPFVATIARIQTEI